MRKTFAPEIDRGPDWFIQQARRHDGSQALQSDICQQCRPANRPPACSRAGPDRLPESRSCSVKPPVLLRPIGEPLVVVGSPKYLLLGVFVFNSLCEHFIDLHASGTSCTG